MKDSEISTQKQRRHIYRLPSSYAPARMAKHTIMFLCFYLRSSVDNTNLVSLQSTPVERLPEFALRYAQDRHQNHPDP